MGPFFHDADADLHAKHQSAALRRSFIEWLNRPGFLSRWEWRRSNSTVEVSPAVPWRARVIE
jgi:hypothetical protein